MVSVDVSAETVSRPLTTVPKRLYVAVGPDPGQAPLTMKNWLPLTGPPGMRAMPTDPASHLRNDAGSSGRLFPGPPAPEPVGSPLSPTQSSVFQHLLLAN